MDIDQQLAAEERRDHSLAAARGERLRLLCDVCITDLFARGILSDRDEARVSLFHVLADHLYGNAAVDVPALRYADPIVKDDDIPFAVRTELMACAVQNGRISYHWLCEVFRKGRDGA